MTHPPTDHASTTFPADFNTGGGKSVLVISTSDGVTTTITVRSWTISANQTIDIPFLPVYICALSEAAEAQERYERHLAFLAWLASLLNIEPRPSGDVFFVQARDAGKNLRPQQKPSSYG